MMQKTERERRAVYENHCLKSYESKGEWEMLEWMTPEQLRIWDALVHAGYSWQQADEIIASLPAKDTHL